MRKAILAVLLCLAAPGCYDFGVDASALACSAAGECPENLACDHQIDRCVRPDEILPPPPPPVLPDAAPPDAFVPGPDTLIATPSAGATTGTIVDVTFVAAGDPAGVTFRCHLDSDSFSACASPQRYTFNSSGAHVVHVQALSPRGVPGAEATRAFAVDASGASVILSGSVANGAITNMSSVIFTFTAAPSDNISGFECSLDNGAFAACTSGGSGATATTATEGQHTFAVRAMRLGVTGAASTWTWKLDTTPPAVSISGPATSAGAPTQNSLPTVIGSAESFALVTLYRSAGCTGPHSAAVAALGGSWSILTTQVEGTQAASDGETDYSAYAVDAAGNPSCSPVLRYFTDNTAPVVSISATTPTTSAAAPAQNRMPQVSGTAENGAAIALYAAAGCSGAPAGAGSASGTGGFTVSLTTLLPADGTTTLYARATDAAGNPACSAGVSYYTDNTAPAVSPTGTTPATGAGTPTMNLRPTVTGNGEAGATVTLYTQAGCSGAAYGTGSAGPGNTFSIATTADAVPTGTTTYYARAVDAAGNPACSAGGVPYYTNNTAPNVSITGTTPATTATTPSMTRTPAVAGNAPTGSTVGIYTTSSCSGAPLASGTAAGSTFSLSVGSPLAADGTTTLFAKATDPVGNSACSAGYAYYTDNTPPAVAILGTNPTTSATTPSQTRNPIVSGTAEKGASVYLYAGVACTGSVKDGPVTASPATGAWSIPSSPLPADGQSQLYAQAIDAAGNPTCSAVVSYFTDNTPPAISVGGTTPSAPTASAPVQNRSPSVSVTSGETGALITLYSTPACTGTAYGADTAGVAGTPFAIATTVAAPSDGGITYYARSVDSAGNARCSTTSAAYYTDNTAPPASITGVTPATTATTPTRTLTPQVTVAAEAGAQVALYGSSNCTGTSYGSGATGTQTSVTLTTAALAANGPTTLYAKATDFAGNYTCSTGVTYYTDTTPPALTVSGTTPATTSANRNKNTSPMVNGTVEVGARVELHHVSDCSDAYDGFLTSSPASYTLTTKDPLGADSVTTFYVKASDDAGNFACAGPVTYYADNTAPTLTANHTPPTPDASGAGTFTYTASDAAAINSFSCMLDSFAVACSSGAATTVFIRAPGAHNFSVTASDTAGNSRTVSFNWVIDTWCVDRAAGSDTNVGSCGAPYKTLGKALPAADSSIYKKVKLAAGTYGDKQGETLPLSIGPGVSLQGDPAGAIPEINSSTGSSDLVMAANSALDRVRLMNGDPTNQTGVGLVVNGTGVNVSNCEVYNWGTGISLGAPASPSAPNVSANLIANVINGNRYGLVQLASAVSKVERSTITFNTSGVRITGPAPLDLGKGSLGSVGGNQITCNTDSDVYNFSVASSAQANYWDHIPPLRTNTLPKCVNGIDVCEIQPVDTAGAILSGQWCP